jgi:hypothetical protein
MNGKETFGLKQFVCMVSILKGSQIECQKKLKLGVKFPNFSCDAVVLDF